MAGEIDGKMTAGQWRQAGYPMVWSIYQEGAYDGQEEHARAQLDLSAPEGMADGIYNVFHHAFTGVSRIGRAGGVEIRQGHFVPGPTQEAIFQAVCRSYGLDPETVSRTEEPPFSHFYIEHIGWDPEDNEFVVFTGS